MYVKPWTYQSPNLHQHFASGRAQVQATAKKIKERVLFLYSLPYHWAKTFIYMSAVLVSPTQWPNVLLAVAAKEGPLMAKIAGLSNELGLLLADVPKHQHKIALQTIQPLKDQIDILRKGCILMPKKVIEIVCRAFGTETATMYNNAKSREWEYTNVRHACMYYLSKYTSLSLKGIGREMQGSKKCPFDHTTVIKNKIVFSDLLDTGNFSEESKVIEAAILSASK